MVEERVFNKKKNFLLSQSIFGIVYGVLLFLISVSFYSDIIRKETQNGYLIIISGVALFSLYLIISSVFEIKRKEERKILWGKKLSPKWWLFFGLIVLFVSLGVVKAGQLFRGSILVILCAMIIIRAIWKILHKAGPYWI